MIWHFSPLCLNSNLKRKLLLVTTIERSIWSGFLNPIMPLPCPRRARKVVQKFKTSTMKTFISLVTRSCFQFYEILHISNIFWKFRCCRSDDNLFNSKKIYFPLFPLQTHMLNNLCTILHYKHSHYGRRWRLFIIGLNFFCLKDTLNIDYMI